MPNFSFNLSSNVLIVIGVVALLAIIFFISKKKSGSGSSPHSGSVLAQFSVDLTQKAADGKLDPVIGRDEEIERVIQILSRRTKNNPVLVGKPGVGKTAIAAFVLGVFILTLVYSSLIA